MNHSVSARAKGRVALAVAGAGVASVLYLAVGAGSPVSAHGLQISGEASCAQDGSYIINYASTAWEGDGSDESRTNPSVIVYASFNGGNNEQVGTGAFGAPTFSFGGQFSAGADTASLVLEAFVAGTWGNGFAGGQQAFATVTLPTNCTPTTTTTTTTSTTTTTTTTTTTMPPPPADDGCTPGYWKNHPESWQGYSPGQTVGSVFTVPASLGLGGSTLLQALSFDGGSGTTGAARFLLRAGTAALLNSSSDGVDYPHTTAEVIADVNAALASNNRSTMLALASQFDSDNNLGCPLT